MVGGGGVWGWSWGGLEEDLGGAGLLPARTSRSQTVLEQREGSMWGLCGRDPDLVLWLAGRVSGSY